MSDNIQLSEHFSFYELTVTSNVDLQEQNRIEAMKYLPTGKALCVKLLEPIRDGNPIIVNSGFRSWELNGSTPGSSPTSQHPMFQAADIHRPGRTAEELFYEILALIVARSIPFGQLILEKADRGYEVAEWVHISLGADYWKPERCGEVLKMTCAPGGKPKYELVQKVPQ